MAVGQEMTEIANYIAGASSLQLPDEVAWRAKQHFLDSIAAVVSGARLAAGLAGQRYMDVVYPKATGVSSVLATTRKGPAVAVAMANGMAAHASETDDSHAATLCHPGCSVAPTVLAAGEEMESSGRELLSAFIVGYDVGCRIGRAVHSIGQSRKSGNWSSHSVVGTLCSSAAAGVIYRFDPDEARYLLSHASQLTSGVTTWVRDQSHVQKAFVFAGMPAMHAMVAAGLVRAGSDGVDDPFFGSPNWLQAMSAESDVSALATGLGREFEVMQATIKKFAVGSPSQAAIEAVVQLIAEYGVTADEVESAVIALPSESVDVVDNRSMPNVNAQYLVAGVLSDGGFTLAMSHDFERLASAEMKELMGRISLVPEEAFVHQRAARVTIERQGGDVIERTVHDVRGTPKNPMTFEETRTKAEDLIGAVLGARRAEAVCDLVADLERLDHVGELVELLVP